MATTRGERPVPSTSTAAGREGAAFRAPPPLRAGDRVAVVAPASPFGRQEFFRGLAWLRGRYTLEVRAGILTRTGYMAGPDARRAEELAWAMTAPGVRAIVAARGGYGITRIVDRLPWRALEAEPRWIVGFSDVTALHLEMQARGLVSLHASHVTGLAGASPGARLAWLRALEGTASPLAWSGLRRIGGPRDGIARGPLVGGNLALVESMAAAGRLVVPEGAVLVLEDVTERPYRIDRMLTSLALGGYLARASAILFGSFTQCDPGPDGVTVDDVLGACARALDVPVLAGAPFGHGAVNVPFALGAEVEVRADAGTVRAL